MIIKLDLETFYLTAGIIAVGGLGRNLKKAGISFPGLCELLFDFSFLCLTAVYPGHAVHR